MSGAFNYRQSSSATSNVSVEGDSSRAPASQVRIAFIERKYWRKNFLAFSLEKVFEQVARLLPAEKFETEIVKVPYGNSVFDIVRNLLRFRRPKADIYHITGQIHYMALVLPPDRTVLTIHDLWAIDQSRSGWLKRTIIKKLLLDMPVRRLNYITAVSETTKRRIVEQSGCDPEKVRVIHDPVQDHFFRPEPKSFDRERPVILQVGITENKNIPRLLRALNGVACLLRIVGNMTPELESELIASGVEFENLLGLSDQEMRLAYRDADIVAFCSTYEGFGLPIVEAQAMERPILTSDLPPMN